MLCIACFPERCPRWAFRRFLLALMCGFIFDSVHVFVAFQNCADVLSSPNCILFHEVSLEVVIQAWAHPHHRDIAGDDVFFIHGCHIMYSGRVAGSICLGHIFCVYVAGIACLCPRCSATLFEHHGICQRLLFHVCRKGSEMLVPVSVSVLNTQQNLSFLVHCYIKYLHARCWSWS